MTVSRKPNAAATLCGLVFAVILAAKTASWAIFAGVLAITLLASIYAEVVLSSRGRIGNSIAGRPEPSPLPLRLLIAT